MALWSRVTVHPFPAPNPAGHLTPRPHLLHLYPTRCHRGPRRDYQALITLEYPPTASKTPQNPGLIIVTAPRDSSVQATREIRFGSVRRRDAVVSADCPRSEGESTCRQVRVRGVDRSVCLFYPLMLLEEESTLGHVLFKCLMLISA